MITHLKLFSDGGQRQVALFSGADESSDWQRNAPADDVLSGGWHLLPKEQLLTLADVEGQGFLKHGSLEPSEPESSDPQRNWQLRCAQLHSRLADAAATAGDHAAEATACASVAALMQQLDDSNRQSAWLLRAVKARLAQWHQGSDPAVAAELAALFGLLAQHPWPGEPDGPAKGAANQRFWLLQALERYAEVSLQAESRGDLASAAAAAEAVVALQQLMPA